MNKQEYEHDSDEESVIFNNSKTRRYVRKEQRDLYSVPPFTGIQSYRNERAFTGHLPTAAFQEKCLEYLKSSCDPGPSHLVRKYDGIPQEPYDHHAMNTSPADRILSTCSQPTKKVMNPRHNAQHQETVQENRHFDGYEQYNKCKPDNQISNQSINNFVFVFRGFDNRYSCHKIQKDLLKPSHSGLSAFLKENETLILKNAWQKEIIPRRKVADEVKAPMTKPGSFSNQNSPDPKGLTPEAILFDDSMSNSSIDDSLPGIEELGEILDETFVDMNNGVEAMQEENSGRNLTETMENVRHNEESETASGSCPNVPFNSSQDHKIHVSKPQTEAAFSVPKPEGERVAVEILDADMHLRCRRYLFGKICSRGDYCSYLHTFPKADNVLCKEFLHGKCTRTAAKCWFKHPGEVIEEDEPHEEGPAGHDSVGTLLSVLKMQQKSEAAPKPSKSQGSASDFVGKVKTSKPKPVGTPRRKTLEQDASSSAAGKQCIKNDKPKQVPPASLEIQNRDGGIFKATCGKENLSVNRNNNGNSLPKTYTVSKNSVNLNQKIETTVPENEKFDKGVRAHKENRTLVGLVKVRKKSQNPSETKTGLFRDENVKNVDSDVSVNTVAVHENGIEVNSMPTSRTETQSCTNSDTRKTEKIVNTSINSGEKGSSIENSTVPGKENHDKQTKKHKKIKEIETPHHINSYGDRGKGKNGECNKSDIDGFSPREKENEKSKMGVLRAEFKNQKSNTSPTRDSLRDSQMETSRLLKDTDRVKNSLKVTKDQNKEHKKSQSKRARSKDACDKSLDQHEKDNAKRRRTERELPGFQNREVVIGGIEPSENDKSETSDVQNLTCNPDNMIRHTESDHSYSVTQSEPEIAKVTQTESEIAKVTQTEPEIAKVTQIEPEIAKVTQTEPEIAKVTQTEPEMASKCSDNSGCEVDGSSVECNALDAVHSENVIETINSKSKETMDESEQHKEKVCILTALTRQWLHDVDGNYINSVNPFDDLCKVIQEMGLEIWSDEKYPDVYVWEVNMRRMFISLYTSLDLETFTKDIHKVMKDVPNIYEFFSVHNSV